MEKFLKIQDKDNIKKSLVMKCKLFFKHIFTRGDFLNNKIIIFLLILNFFSNLSNWMILAIFSNKIDEGIILHYNVYFGVDSTGNWKQTFIMPLIGTFLFLLNTVLAVFFYKNKERIASYILLLVSLMIHIGLIVASSSILLINY